MLMPVCVGLPTALGQFNNWRQPSAKSFKRIVRCASALAGIGILGRRKKA